MDMSRRGTNARIALSLVGQFKNQRAGLDVRTRGADHSGPLDEVREMFSRKAIESAGIVSAGHRRKRPGGIRQ